MQEVNIAIIIVTHNRPELLKLCLDSIMAAKANAPLLKTSVNIGINGYCPETSELLKNYNDIQSIKIPFHQTPAKARNSLIQNIEADWFCFLDDDVEVPLNYFETAENFLKEHQSLYIFGGPDLAPLNPSPFQEALALAQMTWLSSAHTRYRHGHTPDKELIISTSDQEFILCNLWIHSSVFKATNQYFPEEYGRNEENVLMHNLKKYGYRFAFLPSLFVHHYKKDSFSMLFHAVYSSGRFRMKSFFDYPNSFHPLYLIPSFFLFYLFSLLANGNSIYTFPLYLYLFLSLLSGCFIVVKNNKAYKIVGRVVIIQIFINLVYGLGVTIGFFEELIHRLQRKNL